MKSQHRPSISIITPSYNQGKYLRQTVDSVLAQGYENLSYYIFDGGSTDESVDVLKTYGKRIEWESKKDKGQSDALNKGWKKVVNQKHEPADLIAYINSDDYFLPNAFEEVIATFASHPDVSWVSGDARIVDWQGKRIQEPIRWYKKIWRMFYLPFVLSVLNPFPQPAVFIKVSAAKKVGLFDENLAFTMDYDYWQRLQKEFGRPFCIHKELACFRLHSSSKGNTSFASQFAEEIAVADHYSSSLLLKWAHRLHVGLILRIYSLLK